MDRLPEKVLDGLRTHRLLEDCSCAVVAVSGGPDSLAMLHVLRDLTPSFPGIRLHVAHLHHGIRGHEADDDAAFVQAEARRLGLEATVRHADVPRLAQESGTGVEAAGRAARYRFFRETAQAQKAVRVATGHTGDDAAETVLMRVRRGAGPRGLAGIPRARPIEDAPGVLVIRPLLDVTRAEVKDFLQKRGLQARLDRTNFSDRYLRNRVRHRMLPAMERAWDGAPLRESLRRLAAAAGTLHGTGLDLARSVSSSAHPLLQPGYAEAGVSALSSAPLEVLAEVFRHWMEATDLWTHALDRRHFAVLAEIVRSGVPCGTSLPGNVTAGRWRDRIYLSRATCSEWTEFSTDLPTPGGAVIAPIGCALEAEMVEAGDDVLLRRVAAKDSDEEYLDAEATGPVMQARFPQPGDRIRLLGAPGSRKVFDILMDRGVPSPRRRRTVLLTAHGAPVWIAGVGIADSARVTERTRRAVRVRLLPSL